MTTYLSKSDAVTHAVKTFSTLKQKLRSLAQNLYGLFRKTRNRNKNLQTQKLQKVSFLRLYRSRCSNLCSEPREESNHIF